MGDRKGENVDAERVSKAIPTSDWAADFKDIKAILPSMNDVDIISFFASFERILELNDVDKSLWAKLLPSQLSPKALRVYARLSLEETKCYDTVKRIILQGYNLDANSYLKSFRTMRRKGQSTYKMFLTSLREMMQRFLDAKTITTFEELVEEYLQEQFLISLKDNVRQFVISKRPANATECAEFADLYFEISKIGSDRRAFGQNRIQADETSCRPNFGANKPPPVNNTATAPYRANGQNTHWHGGKFRQGGKPNTNRFGPANGGKPHAKDEQTNKSGAFFANNMRIINQLYIVLANS